MVCASVFFFSYTMTVWLSEKVNLCNCESLSENADEQMCRESETWMVERKAEQPVIPESASLSLSLSSSSSSSSSFSSLSARVTQQQAHATESRSQQQQIGRCTAQ